ncbi:MAG: hypothetical protein DK306_001720 [Chloroflexi bacterium]|nr:MAG: hypothetical protein DK306_001720 [Chloroflexota bacterium]
MESGIQLVSGSSCRLKPTKGMGPAVKGKTAGLWPAGSRALRSTRLVTSFEIQISPKGSNGKSIQRAKRGPPGGKTGSPPLLEPGKSTVTGT